MVNWREVVSKVGINQDLLLDETEAILQKIDFLCRRAGGSLCSRQIVAATIVNEQPELVDYIANGEGPEEEKPKTEYDLLWGYYNFCMDEFNGNASEEAIDMYLEALNNGE